MKVAVVGAGIAGLSAARSLHEAGVEVVVFDKSRGRGGRLARRKLAWGEVDLGAPAFHAAHPDFLQQVNQWCKAGLVSAWRPNRARLGEGSFHADGLADDLYVGLPFNNVIAHTMADDLPLQLSTRIRSSCISNGKITLYTSNSDSLVVDAVVFAVPLPQLPPLLPDGCYLSNSLPAQSMQAQCAAILQFEKPIATPGFDLIDIEEHFCAERLVHHSALPGRKHSGDIWGVYFRADWSAENLDGEESVLINIARDTLAQVLKQSLPTLNGSALQRWRFASHALPPLADSDCIDRDRAVVICGDWSLGGQLESAWLSGRRAASLLLSPETSENVSANALGCRR